MEGLKQLWKGLLIMQDTVKWKDKPTLTTRQKS